MAWRDRALSDEVGQSVSMRGLLSTLIRKRESLATTPPRPLPSFLAPQPLRYSTTEIDTTECFIAETLLVSCTIYTPSLEYSVCADQTTHRASLPLTQSKNTIHQPIPRSATFPFPNVSARMHVSVTYFIANLEAYARRYNVHTSLLPP